MSFEEAFKKISMEKGYGYIEQVCNCDYLWETEDNKLLTEEEVIEYALSL